MSAPLKAEEKKEVTEKKPEAEKNVDKAKKAKKDSKKPRKKEEGKKPAPPTHVKKVKPFPKAKEKKKLVKSVKAEAKEAEKKKSSHFIVDCSLPSKDKVFQAKELVTYFLDHIKVDGKKKNLTEKVAITCEDGKKIHVKTDDKCKQKLAKRYLKYLSKKFLKKHEVRDFLRLVAPNKSGYEFKYFKMESGE